MPDTKAPRHGSMQYWPRTRSKRSYARIRNHSRKGYKAGQLCGFAGYKVGMTHVIATDNYKNSHLKGMDCQIPVTIIECPPITVLGARFYKGSEDGVSGDYIVSEVLGKVKDKNLKRKIRTPKKEASFDSLPEYDELRLLVFTQPSKTSIGKKKPDVFEMVVAGSKDEQLAFAKENVGKDVNLPDVFEAGQAVDVYSITKGKGNQGPVKRFGVKIRQRKSEKTVRGPGSIAGGWKAQGHMMYRVAFSGQLGYFQRKEFNKWILQVGDNPEEINPKGGFVNYGLVKNPYLLVKGSIPGPKNRLVKMSLGVRPSNKIHKSIPTIKHVSVESQQR